MQRPLLNGVRLRPAMIRVTQPTGRMRAAYGALLLAAALAAGACARGSEGAGELRARKVVLEQEVNGLRELIALHERHEPLLPPGDFAIGIDEALLQGMISAQLPF